MNPPSPNDLSKVIGAANKTAALMKTLNDRISTDAAQVQRQSATAYLEPTIQASPSKWPWIVGGIAVLGVLWFLMRRRAEP